MIDCIQVESVKSAVDDLFNLLTDGNEEKRNFRFTLKLIKKIVILDGTKQVGSIEIQSAKWYDSDCIRIAYQIYDSPIIALVGERSCFINIDFTIKTPTVLEYLDSFVQSKLILKALYYKYNPIIGVSSVDDEEIKEQEDAFNNIEGLLKKLCNYELLVNTDGSIAKYSELSPLEVYLSLAVAKDLQGFHDYYNY